jgi:NAD(P)-dependent dehydrogenase (short-subunit alcohol dehydrogenase family)
MDRRLEGKVAIITGAGTGIGEAIAHKFATVVLNGLADDPIEDVVQAIKHYGGKAISYSGDVSQEYHAQNCVQTQLIITKS